MMEWNHNGGAWAMMLVLMLLLLAGLVIFGWLLLNKPDQPGSRSLPPPPGRSGADPVDALRILDERLARGELDPEDYRLRRQLLVEGRSSTVGQR